MKRFVSILSAIVMTAVAVSVVLTFGINTKTALADGGHTHCVCGENCVSLNDTTAPGYAQATASHGACDSSQVWTAWTDATKLPTQSGYYYLTQDVTTASNYFTEDDQNVFLCLNGHTVTQTGARTYSNYKDSTYRAFSLSICDCKGTGKIETREIKDNNDGGMFWVAGIACNVTFYNVTIDASKRNVTSKKGAILESPASAAGSSFTIYGGTYYGGSAYRGGAFSISAAKTNHSTFTMFDGLITGGTAIVDAASTANAVGGNICTASATVNIYGGTIEKGQAIAGIGVTSTTDSTPKTLTSGAGNIGALNSDLFLADGATVRLGVVETSAGVRHIKDVWVYADKNNHASYNGTVYEPTDKSSNYYPDFGHDHCECGENVDTSKSSHTCTQGHNWTALTGSVDVADNGEYYYYLTKDLTSAVSFGGGSSSVKKSVKVHLCLNGYNITANVSRAVSLWCDANSILTICDCCASRQDAEVYKAGRIGYSTTRTTMVEASTTQGYIISYQGAATVYGGIIDATWKHANNVGGTLYAGKNVEIYGGHLYGATLDSTDTRPGGSARNNNGGVVYAGGTFTMYGGELEGGIVKAGLESLGGCVYSAGAFTMHGGKIHGGQVIQFSSEKKYAKGGCVYAGGNFTMTGGEIYGGTSSIDASVTANKWAAAGNVYLQGTTNTITGGKIYDGTAGSCGNIYINGSTKTLTIENATISGGYGNTGGNIENEGATLTIKEGTVISGGVTSSSSTGGNIFMSKGVLNIQGGTITGGQSGVGGNIYINSKSADVTVTISGGLFEKGKMLKNDYSVPNVAINCSEEYQTTVTITGGTFTVEDPSKENAIYIYKGTNVDISGDNTFIERLYTQPEGTPSMHGGYVNYTPYGPTLREGYAAVELDSAKASGGKLFRYEVCVSHPLTVTSWLVDAEGAKVSSGIATISGGSYAKNNVGKTIAASEVPNYTFYGWATMDSADADTYTLIPDATELIYTTAGGTEPEFYVALYKAANTTVHYEVTGNATVAERALTGDVPVGTSISVSYIGTNPFVGFTNEFKKLISQDTTLELCIYTDTQIIAEEKSATPNLSEVIFLTEGNQIYEKVADASALTALPSVPIRPGKTGGFWSLEKGGEEATLDDVKALIPQQSIMVYLTGFTGETPKAELTAGDTAQVKMNIHEKTQTGDTYTVSFGATRLLPEGWTIVEQGILITTSAKVSSEAKAKEALVFGSDKCAKIRAVSTELNSVTAANIKNVPAHMTIYAVGYVVYLRAGSTTPEYAYSALSSVHTSTPEEDEQAYQEHLAEMTQRFNTITEGKVLNNYDSAVAAITAEPIETGKIVFYGSSSFTRWSEKWGNPNLEDMILSDAQTKIALNHGIGGSNISHLCHYYEQLVKPYEPKALCIYGMSNNGSEYGYSTADLIFMLDYLLEQCRHDFPGIHFYVGERQGQLGASANSIATYLAIDEALYAYEAEHDDVTIVRTAHQPFYYQDAASIGTYTNFREEIFISDGVHLVPEAYEGYADIWRSYIKNELK